MMIKISERLEKVLENKGLSRYQLSKISGVSEMGLSRIVNNVSNPNKSTLKSISDALNIRIEWLETGEGEMNKNSEPEKQEFFTITNNKDVLKLQKEVSDLETSLERKNKEIEFLRNNMNKQVDLINKQYSQIAEQNDRIAKLNDRIAEQNNQIAKLNDQIKR